MGEKQCRHLRVASGATAPGPALEGAPRFRPKTVIYRVFQEESARLREMIVYVILSKKVNINMCPIFDGYGFMGIF